METESPEAGGWVVSVGGSAGGPEPPLDRGVLTDASYPTMRSRVVEPAGVEPASGKELPTD